MKRILLILPGAFTGGITVAISVAIGIAGCSRSDNTTGPATEPSGQPSVPVAVVQTSTPATHPATTTVSRPPSIMLIGDKRYDFPPGILQVRKKDGQLTATLMSDDPKDAIDENYHGNSFYIQMPLDGTDVKDLNDSPWQFADQSGERSDSPNGIFLDGNRIQLQPATAKIKFVGKPPEMMVTISGQFAQFQTRDDSKPPQFVTVTTDFTVQVSEQK